MAQDSISRSGAKSSANSNGQGNGHPRARKLASESLIPSVPDWLDVEFVYQDTSRDSRGGSPPVKPNGKERRRSDLAQRSRRTVSQSTELGDGSLVDVVEDPDDPRRTLLAVWKDGKATYHNELEQGGDVLVPLPRDGQIFRHVRLPRWTESYESVRGLLLSLHELITGCVDVKEEYQTALLCFVLTTWVADQLPVAPYLSIVGLPESGKTTLLRVLSMVCRRPLLTADITSAAFYEACAQLNPTLLIDESGASGDSRGLRQLLRMGTTRDVLVVRKNQVFNAYAPKVICWKEPPDDPALNSRCVEIQMIETENVNLLRPSDPAVEQLAAKLQAQLLWFRFEHHKKVRAPAISDMPKLRPRTRDLLACLAAPVAEDPEICGDLVRFFKERDFFTQEPLPPEESAVLTALFSQIHQTAYTGLVHIGDLATKVNSILEAASERLRVSPKRVGGVMSTLGFRWKRRTNKGWITLLGEADQLRIHQLAATHGMDQNLDRFIGINLRDCPLCNQT